jgi:hypothetical protein
MDCCSRRWGALRLSKQSSERPCSQGSLFLDTLDGWVPVKIQLLPRGRTLVKGSIKSTLKLSMTVEIFSKLDDIFQICHEWTKTTSQVGSQKPFKSVTSSGIFSIFNVRHCSWQICQYQNLNSGISAAS